MDFLMNKWWIRKMRCEIIVADFIHELDHSQIGDRKPRFFRDFSKCRLHRLFVIFDFSLRENVLELIASVFPCQHKNLEFSRSLTVDDSPRTFLMYFRWFFHQGFRHKISELRTERIRRFWHSLGIMNFWWRVYRKSEKNKIRNAIDFQKLFHRLVVLKKSSLCDFVLIPPFSEVLSR